MSVIAPGITSIEASAGTGKTFRLAQLALELVAVEGLPIGRIVIVTFTEAATAELRHRVRARLRDGLAGLRARERGEPVEAPDEVLQTWLQSVQEPKAIEWLEQALIDIDEAAISTLHGFCARVLRYFAFEVGAAFGTEVGGAGDVAERVVSDLLRRLLATVDHRWIKGLEAVGLDREVLTHLAGLAAELELHVVPDVDAVEPPELGPWNQAVKQLREAFPGPNALHALVWGSGAFHKARSSAKGIEHSRPDKGTLNKAWDLKRFLDRPGLVGEAPECLGYFSTEELELALIPGRSLPEHEVFAAVDRLLEVRASLGPQLSQWATRLRRELVDTLREQRALELVRKDVRGFDDMLRAVRDALVHPERGPNLVEVLRDRFTLALVDEFQDTDPVQWQIFEAVFAPERLVLIGDPKQSIYAFRRADIHAYLQAVAKAGVREDLPDNYRSDKNLVDALNHVWKRDNLPFGADRPTYEEVKPFHAASRLPGDTRPALELVHLLREGWSGGWTHYDFMKKWDLEPCMPDLVAADVVAELNRGTLIDGEGGPRAVRPRDCAILTRTNPQASSVREALRRRGVPAVLRSKDSVLETSTAQDLGRVLDAVLSPTDRSAISAALCSALVGRLGEGLRVSRAEGGDWSAQVEQFRELQQVWSRQGVLRMLNLWMEREGVLGRLLSQPGGERQAADLRHVIELLHRAEGSERLGPWALRRWLDQGGPGLDEEVTRQRVETDEDAVRISTVHSAKGLEYPLVWLPYAWNETWIGANDRKNLKYHDIEQGWTLDVEVPPDPDHIDQAMLDHLQEDLRMTYVAMTRARHRCVVYWAPTDNVSALAYLLHGSGADVSSRRKRGYERTKKDEYIAFDLKQLARHPGIGVRSIRAEDEPPLNHWSGTPLGDRELLLRPLTRADELDTWWRRTSFSNLCKGDERQQEWEGDDESEPSEDRDEEVFSWEPLESVEGGETLPTAELEGGTELGDAVHEILEHHDYSRPEQLRSLVEGTLAEHHYGQEWFDAVHDSLDSALKTPLGHGFSFEDLHRDQTLRELDFALRLRGGYGKGRAMGYGQLAAVFEDAELGPGAPKGTAQRIRDLEFLPAAGFLVGSVDLLAQHGGRYWVVDWKSNKLGPTHLHYAGEHLRRAMHHSAYVLQYHLYTVAVHRFLQQRLAGYDYDTHFGGVIYAFVRSMSPRWGSEIGVFRDRPPKALVEHLDRVLEAPDAE